MNTHVRRQPPAAKEGIILLVCGGRDYNDRDAVFDALDHVAKKRGVDVLIHGGAPGADSLAGQWAELRGVFCLAFIADWNKYGKKAGPIRNRLMLTMNPNGVVAFPGGIGTADMISQAKAQGVNVWEPYAC